MNYIEELVRQEYQRREEERRLEELAQRHLLIEEPIRRSNSTIRKGVSPTKKLKTYAKTNGKCWYCGIQTTLEHAHTKDSYRTDHYIAIEQGGNNDISNLVPSCRECNNLKSAHDIESFKKRYVRIKKLGIPWFDEKQKVWLSTIGVHIDEIINTESSKYKFYFEIENLTP